MQTSEKTNQNKKNNRFHLIHDVKHFALSIYEMLKNNIKTSMKMKEENLRYKQQRKQELFNEDKQVNKIEDILFPNNARTGKHTVQIILFATFSLQLISLTTTYRGARYYLLDVNALAPFLFACVVQVLLFYFSKQAGQQSYMKPNRYAIFIFIVCISILTSYVGIMNNTISPLADYKNQYRDYQNSFDITKEELSAIYGDYVSFERSLNSIENQANQLIQVTNNAISSIQKNSGRLQSIQPSTSITTTTNQIGESSVTQNIDQSNLTDAIEKIAENEEQAEQLDTALKQLENNVKKSNIDSIKTDLENVVSGKQEQPSQSTYTKYQNLVLSYNHLLQLLNQFMQESGLSGMSDLQAIDISLDQLMDMIQNYEDFENLSLENIETLQNKHGILESDTTDTSFFRNFASAFLPFINMHQEEYQKFKTDLEMQISDSYYEIQKHANILSQMDPSEVDKIMNEFDKSYEKNHSFTDITVIAFSRFFESASVRNTAIICFILAALVDGISAILPIFWFHRYRSFLYGRKKYGKNLEEELLYELYYAAASRIPMEADTSFQSYVCKVIEYLQTYFQLYQEIPYMKEHGYVMAVNAGAVEREEYHTINAVLLSLKQVNTISVQDVKQVRHEYYHFGDSLGNLNNEKEYMYIMRTELLLWIQQHLLQILHNQKLMIEKVGE